FRMRNGNELHVIDEERFFELIRHAYFVTSVALAQEIARNANVLIGVGDVETSGRIEMAHLTAAHEICDKLKAFAVPDIKIRTRRWFTIKLRERERLRVRDLRFSLHYSGRPQHAHRIDRGAFAESEDQVSRSRSRRSRVSFEL